MTAHIADEAVALELEVPSGEATPLSRTSRRCSWVTLWRVPCDLGVGGKALDTDAHLEAGEHYTARVGDLAGVYVFQRTGAPVVLRFTIGV